MAKQRGQPEDQTSHTSRYHLHPKTSEIVPRQDVSRLMDDAMRCLSRIGIIIVSWEFIDRSNSEPGSVKCGGCGSKSPSSVSVHHPRRPLSSSGTIQCSSERLCSAGKLVERLRLRGWKERMGMISIVRLSDSVVCSDFGEQCPAEVDLQHVLSRIESSLRGRYVLESGRVTELTVHSRHQPRPIRDLLDNGSMHV